MTVREHLRTIETTSPSVMWGTASKCLTGWLQCDKDEGIGVLFRGLGPACLEKVPSTAIGYYIYEGMKVAMGVKSV